MKQQKLKIKNTAWDRAEAKVNKLTDKLGKGIDEDVREPVIALNALGINTDASCEGHANRATGAPYIDIEARETKAILKLKKRYAQMSTRRSPSDSFYVRLRKLSDRIERYNQKEAQKALSLLGDFYRKRNVPYDRRIIVRSWSWSNGRLESQGACILPMLSRPERLRKLRLYQEEMKRLAKFLKKRIFKKRK